MTIDDELLGSPDTDRYPKKARGGWKRWESLGPLHELLSRGLPDLAVNDFCDVPLLAKHLGMTNAGVYAWCKKNRIPANQVERVVALSKKQKTKGFRALTREDFWAFLST